jgi:hypothetical protein
MTLNTSGLLVGGVNRVSWMAEAEQLRNDRGEWRLLCVRKTRDCARMTVSQINRGALYAFRPAGDFEAYAQHGAVYARYLGDGMTETNKEKS